VTVVTEAEQMTLGVVAECRLDRRHKREEGLCTFNDWQTALIDQKYLTAGVSPESIEPIGIGAHLRSSVEG
jgi:hypothetical protein